MLKVKFGDTPLIVYLKSALNVSKFENKDTRATSLYLLKTSENQRVSDVFRGYREVALVSFLLTLNIFGKIFHTLIQYFY